MINIIQLLASMPVIFTLDALGRRPLLLVGSVGMTMAHLGVAAVAAYVGRDWRGRTVEGNICAGLIYFFTLSYGLSWGPIAWTVPSEIFPTRLRARGVAISTASNWINNFFIGLITPPMLDVFHWGTYLFFGIFCALSAIWVWTSVPETRQVALEDMVCFSSSLVIKGSRIWGRGRRA